MRQEGLENSEEGSCRDGVVVVVVVVERGVFLEYRCEMLECWGRYPDKVGALHL